MCGVAVQLNGHKALIFPGQGAQYVGMGQDLFSHYAPARRIFEEADDFLGYKLSEICFQGPAEKLTDTAIQQLAILVSSIAAFSVLKENFPFLFPFSYVSGLSLGEYTALYAAEVLNFKDLLLLVKERAQAMQEAARINPSCMLAALGVDGEVVFSRQKEGGYFVANLNSPGQVVVSLKKEDKEKVREILVKIGAARVVELDVSGGFHSPFMEPARQCLEKVVSQLEFHSAATPVVGNYTAAAAADPEKIKNNLLDQLIYPVRWQDCIVFMKDKGVKQFFEVGPSRVLRGLLRKIDRSFEVINLDKPADFSALADKSKIPEA